MTIIATPSLVTAPVAPVVTLAEAKAHLRVDHADEDAQITMLEKAAVAHFDGWKGVLGRAIMAQTWAYEFDAWGDLRIPMPDASAIAVEWHDGSEFVALDAFDVGEDARGAYVAASGPAATRIRVTATHALPAEQLPAAQAAVLLTLGHWYAHREAVIVGATTSDLPFGVDALISALRWRII